MANRKKIRVLLTKIGLDGHDRGIKVVAMGLMDAGMEVIYTGLYASPEEVLNTAIQEDVDVVGVSCLSGGHLTIFHDLTDLFKKEGRDVLIIGGGTIPQDEIPILKGMGVSEVFRSGSKISQMVDHIRSHVAVPI